MSNYLSVDNTKILTSITQNISEVSAKITVIGSNEIQDIIRVRDNIYSTKEKLLLNYTKISNIIIVLLEYERICRMLDQRLNSLSSNNLQQVPASSITLESITSTSVKNILRKIADLIGIAKDLSESISQILYGLGTEVPEMQNRLSEGSQFQTSIELESIESIVQQSFYLNQQEYMLEVLREATPRLLPRLRGIGRDTLGKILFSTESTFIQNPEVILEELKLKIQYNSN